jgi:hypothetical protein
MQNEVTFIFHGQLCYILYTVVIGGENNTQCIVKQNFNTHASVSLFHSYTPNIYQGILELLDSVRTILGRGQIIYFTLV